MKKLIVGVACIITILTLMTGSTQAGCLEYGGSQGGHLIEISEGNNDYSEAGEDPSMWMMNIFINPDWLSYSWFFNPHKRNWLATFPKQAMHMVLTVTKISYTGKMVVGGETATIIPGNVYNFEHQIEGCGQWANAHIDVRLYSTLPPIGTQMDRAQYWLNSN